MPPGLARSETRSVADGVHQDRSEPCSWESIVGHIRAFADDRPPNEAADLRAWADLLEALDLLRAD
ncbi:hypothetical protein [Sphingomonas sp.]|uniref:hypothetical protein n=1 Tax=Sphingomonas sp. TaxID=28214 RepID=UPI00286E06C6|nr:hypothetical protein [Sphingomonas sp.]